MHARTHKQTATDQFSAITFLHLNASSLIFSAQVYSEVVPDHASFDRPILCLLFIELTHRSKVVLSCHMNVNTALNLTNTEISNSDFWFPFSAVVILLLFRTLFWRWTEMAIISFVVDYYYVVSSPDCSAANIWGYSFFNLEPVCESAHRGKFNMKFTETDTVCNMQPYEICGLVFECGHLSGLRKQIQKTFKKIHLYSFKWISVFACLGEDEAMRKGKVLTLLAEQALQCLDFKASYIHCQDLMAAGNCEAVLRPVEALGKL